jgi:hypothetical protein
MPLAAKIADALEIVVTRFLGKRQTVFVEFDWDSHSTMQQVRAERFTTATSAVDRGMPWQAASEYFRLKLPRFAGDSIGRVPFNLTEIGGVPSDQSAVISEEMQALRMALAADMQPLGDALFSAYQAGDAAAMTAALKKISQSMPELAGDATALSEELSGRMVAAFLGEDAEEVANDGNSPGAKLGWETRRANGWVPAPRLITPQEADAELDKGFFVANRAGEKIRFGAELKRKLDDKVINDDDRAARKKRLRWAKLAVSEGSHETTKRHGNVRTIYAKTFRQGPKHQDVEVIVDTINGYAWNIMVKGGSPNALR